MNEDNVISISEYAFKKKLHSYWPSKDVCAHLNMTMHDDGHVVRCDDCTTQLSAYWVLDRMLEKYRNDADSLSRQRTQLAAEKAKDIHLLAARRVDQAWRSKSMVPTCPHCHEAIFPNDGFGASSTNKEIALRRRKIAHDAKVKEPPK